MISIESDSGTRLHSPYKTPKELKIGDAVEMVRKLYGEPLEQVNMGMILTVWAWPIINIPINLDNYYKVLAVKAMLN